MVHKAEVGHKHSSLNFGKAAVYSDPRSLASLAKLAEDHVEVRVCTGCAVKRHLHGPRN
jgi:hypothetical protein